MYCERCRHIAEGVETDVCPNCGYRALRVPHEDDFCFLTEREAMWGEMLADVLRQDEIPFVYEKALGAGLALKTGPARERYRFYIPYERLNEGTEVVRALFESEKEE